MVLSFTKHDSTEFDNEEWCKDIESFLKPIFERKSLNIHMDIDYMNATTSKSTGSVAKFDFCIWWPALLCTPMLKWLITRIYFQ